MLNLPLLSVIWTVILAVHPVHGLSTPSLLGNARHVCLLDSYEEVQGLPFATLLDEAWEQTGFSEKRAAYITMHPTRAGATDVQQLANDLEWDACETIYLNESKNNNNNNNNNKKNSKIIKGHQQHMNPMLLKDTLERLNPSILWVSDHVNAYVLRHYMRITGLDGRIQQLCGSANGQNSVLYVGEGAGALCAGATMTVAQARGDDPRAAPEPQFRGLELLGPSRSVSFTKPMDAPIKDNTSNTNQNILRLNPKQVYLWSQEVDGSTTSLIMNPYQRGALEQFSRSLPPVPPLVEDSQHISSVARSCTGEPSVDPSRSPEILRQLEQLHEDDQEGSDYW